jgi:hypothetical protein
MNKFSKMIPAAMMALTLSSALAHAGSLHLSTSTGQVRSLNQRVATPQPMAQDAKSTNYKLDDGASEDAIGFGDGSSNSPSIFFNQFKTVKGGEAISAVQIAYGTPDNSTTADQLNGTKVTVGIWSDPNNDGDLSDAKLIASVKGKISKANTDTFVTYTFATPVVIGKAGTSFFVGEVTPAETSAQYFFQGIDTTKSAGHSWVAAQASGNKLNIKKPGKNDTVGTIDSFGLPGNWMIRATGVASN